MEEKASARGDEKDHIDSSNVHSLESKHTKLRYILYVSGFVDLLGVSLLIPVLTREARKYNATPFSIGLFTSLYGFLQLVSGPLVGLMSDHLGRNKALMICLFGASSGYFMLSFANSFFLLVVSRIPSGLFKHSQSLARAYLVDITPESKRTAVFGTFNSISSIGFIIGPLVGGHLVTMENGFSKIAFLTALSFWLNAALIHTTVSKMDLGLISIAQDSRKSNSKRSLSPSPHLVQALRKMLLTMMSDIRSIPWHCVWDIFLIRFLSSLAVILFRSNFSTILELRYNASPKTVGYIISFNSFITTFGGLLVGHIVKTFKKDGHAHNLFMFGMFSALGVIAFSPNVSMIVLLLVPLCISTSVLRACSATIVYRKASDQEVGLLTGLTNSTLSVSRMLAPAIGGLSQEYSLSGPGVLAALISGFAFIFAVTCDLDSVPGKATKAD